MAMELYNRLYPHEAESAGTQVEAPGQILAERPTAHSAIEAMKQLGVDMSTNRRRQLTPEMLPHYDRVVVLAETKSIPAYLNTWPAAEMWHIEDTRRDPVSRAIVVRDNLALRIEDFGKRLHQN